MPIRVCIVLLAVAAGVTLMHAQSSPNPPAAPDPQATQAASIRGVVVSKEGEVYQGVRVTLSSGGAEQTRQTDTSGEFLFEQVAPGTYTLTFASQGFKTQTVSGELHPGEAASLPNVVLGFRESVSEIHVSAEQQELVADQQIHVEEQQRVMGVLPNYYVSYDPNPVPLTSKQKFKLAWHTNIDPFNWFLNAGLAGIQQATNSFKGYGGGWQGYGKRMGANTADGFFSDMIGNAILPSLFRQDPRYFYKGTGTVKSRIGYALAYSVICKGDNMHQQFNYSGILGSLASGGISNLYYPESERSDLSVTFEGAGIGIGSTAIQNLFQEFIVKKLTPHANRNNAP
jgi:hypothetical protein